MKITDIDYYAVTGNSIFHKINAKSKILFVFLILLTVVFNQNVFVAGFVYLVVFTMVLFSGFKKNIFQLSLYPLFFLLIFFISFEKVSLDYILFSTIKVLTAVTSFILLIFSTPYIDIFKSLNKLMPKSISLMFFMTYRSIFILFTVLENMKIAVKLRGELTIKKPIYSLKLIGNILGYLFIKSIDLSEKMYIALKFKGIITD